MLTLNIQHSWRRKYKTVSLLHSRDMPFNATFNNISAISWRYTSFLGIDHFTCRASTTRELEYLLFLSRKVRIHFPQFNIRLYDKNSESDYFYFLHQNQNIFSATLGIRIFFLEKKPYPPPPSSSMVVLLHTTIMVKKNTTESSSWHIMLME